MSILREKANVVLREVYATAIVEDFWGSGKAKM